MKYGFEIYLLIGLLTFGWEASSKETCGDRPPECHIVGAVASGLIWPGYWTWELFTQLRKEAEL